MVFRHLSWPWRVLHVVILGHLLLQIAYSGYQVFFVVRPPGVTGPLGAAAREIGFEMMVTRRLYAIEHWIAFVGLVLYVALTEMLPRLRAAGAS